MRVFLKSGKTIEKSGGAKMTWPPEAFCEVPDELGREWIDTGDAYESTRDNVATIPPEPEPEPEPDTTEPAAELAYVEADVAGDIDDEERE